MRRRRIRHRAHRMDVSLEHHAPAYLDEEYPIAISVTNMDTCPLEIVVDVLLQPPEIDHAGAFEVVSDCFLSLMQDLSSLQSTASS